MKTLILCIALCVAALFLSGCAANTIRPVDGIEIELQADIDRVKADVEISPPLLACAGEKLIPFPLGKVGLYCDAVRAGSGSDSGVQSVGEGSL